MSQLSYSHNRISTEDLDRLSSVGELRRSTYVQENPDKHLDYPRVRDISREARYILEQGLDLVFSTSQIHSHSSIEDPHFLNDLSFHSAISNKLGGIPVGLFGALLTPRLSNSKILGNNNFAYIEGKAASMAFKTLYQEGSVDHFFFNQGVSSLALIEDIVRAWDFKSNDLPIFVIPENGIKAFRNTKMGPWTLVQMRQQEASFNKGSVLYLNHDGQILEEIQLAEEYATNLFFPLYKVKIQDRWIIVIPSQTDYKSINKALELKLSSGIETSIKHSGTTIHCSVGQAARAIYELFGASFDNLPEALLQFEGGSWSSMIEDHSSSSRHLGTHSMYDILKNQWFKSDDISIPWNYLGFDRLDEGTQDLFTEDSFLLSLDTQARILFVESNQNWKKESFRLVYENIKNTYEQYSKLGSQKYLLSNKELFNMVAKFLARTVLDQSELTNNSDQLPAEIFNSLQEIALAHMSSSALGDFYSSPNHPETLKRHYRLLAN